MEFQGLKQLRKHVPDLRSPGRCALIGLIAITIIGLETAFFLAADHYWPSWTLDGQVIMITLAFLVIGQFFWRKKQYQERYKKRAYRNAFARYALPGLAMMMAAVAHVAYMPGPAIPVQWWTPGITLIGVYFIIVGIALWARAIWAFGADNLAMLYVYFPEEGRMVQSTIYGLIRHPTYAAVVRIAFGLALLNGNWFAITFALLVPLGLTGWLRLVEEKELIERFGQIYAEYRRKVPAFWPRVGNWGKFMKCLLSGK